MGGLPLERGFREQKSVYTLSNLPRITVSVGNVD